MDSSHFLEVCPLLHFCTPILEVLNNSLFPIREITAELFQCHSSIFYLHEFKNQLLMWNHIKSLLRSTKSAPITRSLSMFLIHLFVAETRAISQFDLHLNPN